jgi:hypothetical protein
MYQSDAVTKAASAFEARWTMLSLKRVDEELYEALAEQRELYYQAMINGALNDQDVQGKALVRGYAKAVHAMESANMPDDSYLVGEYEGLMVVVSGQKVAFDRWEERNNIGRIIIISPDEVAYLFATVNGLEQIEDIKRMFPGAEIIERIKEELT